jgi:hypothetical protein
MKHLFLTILWILTAILRGYSQQEVSLQNCIEAAQQHQPLARQQPLIEAAGQAALEQLRTGWWPQATLNGQATWQSDVTALPIRLPNFEVPSISQDQYRLTLDLLQPLWDGGQVQHQSNLQKAQTLIEQQRLQTEQYAVKEQVIQLYCAALLAQQQKEVLTTLQKDVRSRKTRAEEQVSNGVAIPMAVQAFSVRLLEMEQQADELESRKTAALEGLRLLTGLPLSGTHIFLQSGQHFFLLLCQQGSAVELNHLLFDGVLFGLQTLLFDKGLRFLQIALMLYLTTVPQRLQQIQSEPVLILTDGRHFKIRQSNGQGRDIALPGGLPVEGGLGPPAGAQLFEGCLPGRLD